MSRGEHTITISVDTSSLDRIITALGDSIEDSIRPAAQAGAQVLYEQVRANVRNLKTYTGNLERSIYQVYSKDHSIEGQKATYHVSWNVKKAPHGINVEYGHYVRYKYYVDDLGRVRPMVRPEKIGTPPPKRRASREAKDAYWVTLDVKKKTVARSFVRNAQSAFPRALDAMEKVLLERLARSFK